MSLKVPFSEYSCFDAAYPPLLRFVLLISRVQVDVSHPAAKSMIELSRAQDEEVGDGTTSVIILSEWRHISYVVSSGDDLTDVKIFFIWPDLKPYRPITRSSDNFPVMHEDLHM